MTSTERATVVREGILELRAIRGRLAKVTVADVQALLEAVDRIDDRPDPGPFGCRKVWLDEALVLALGADRVVWCEPDAAGFYTPTLYAEGGD